MRNALLDYETLHPEVKYALLRLCLLAPTRQKKNDGVVEVNQSNISQVLASASHHAALTLVVPQPLS